MRKESRRKTCGIFYALLKYVLCKYILLSEPCVVCRNELLSVYDGGHYGSHDEGCEYIEERVLLDEHGRHDDQYADNQRGVHKPSSFLGPLAVSDAKMSSDGVKYVDAGPQVRRCIGPVKRSDHV